VPIANYNLAIAYAEGRAVARDSAIACTYYRRAAEQGHILAAFALGEAYRAGAGVDLAADDAIMNPECHERMKHK